MVQSEWTHRKISFTEQKVYYNIIYHKQERTRCFFMTLFNAYQVIHTWCEQNEPLKLSLNFFVETSISNTLSTVKLILKFPIMPERKIILRRKIFGPILLP